ncbi:MAG: hypothetical protein HY700_20590 [Gemmatimonadetes bacterium]|nr:hypothetical protein [Gemmatimonadota bacterium]
MRHYGITLIAALFLGLPSSLQAQTYKYYSPGSVWAVQLVKIKYGQDQNYLAYLDGTFKKSQDAQVKAGIIKSYKVLRTFDDHDQSWNMMLMYEYPSLAAFEASRQREDSIQAQVFGSEAAVAEAAEDRLRMREPMGQRMMRELLLK